MSKIQDNPRLLRKYRELRAMHGDKVQYPAPVAVSLVRNLASEPDAYDDGSMIFERTVKGVDVRVVVTATPDPYYNASDSFEGKFTDTYTGGAFQHPGWRPDQYASDAVYRWFVPMESVESLHQFYRRTHGRHDAWLRAVRQVHEDLRMCSGETVEGLNIEATVYVDMEGENGKTLASTSLGTDVLAYEDRDDQLLMSIIHQDVLPEVLDLAADEVGDGGMVSGDVLTVHYDANDDEWTLSARRHGADEWTTLDADRDLDTLLSIGRDIVTGG